MRQTRIDDTEVFVQLANQGEVALKMGEKEDFQVLMQDISMEICRVLSGTKIGGNIH